MKAISVVIAGGGTAGHVEPALALADAVRRAAPEARITALGTQHAHWKAKGGHPGPWARAAS